MIATILNTEYFPLHLSFNKVNVTQNYILVASHGCETRFLTIRTKQMNAV
jgi:hypothetical protein